MISHAENYTHAREKKRRETELRNQRNYIGKFISQCLGRNWEAFHVSVIRVPNTREGVRRHQ